MKTPNAKGLFTTVYDRFGIAMSEHKSLIAACDYYGVKYKTVKDFKRRNPNETAYPVWAKKYTQLKYTIHWGKK